MRDISTNNLSGNFKISYNYFNEYFKNSQNLTYLKNKIKDFSIINNKFVRIGNLNDYLEKNNKTLAEKISIKCEDILKLK